MDARSREKKERREMDDNQNLDPVTADSTEKPVENPLP